MTVEYLDLADYVAIAAAVTGLDLQTVMKMTNLNLADSALHAPAAGFGEDEFYPDFVDKAAVLLVRLARNHPLPDGNQARRLGLSATLRRDQRLDLGTPHRRSMTLRPQCSRSPPATGMKAPRRLGYEATSSRSAPRIEAPRSAARR